MLTAAHYPRVDTALAKLRSLHDGDIGVVETIASGEAAIPELQEILFSREPSGIYETRCRAVEALAGLGALDVLRGFLATSREITDPVERTGEDAVINAAARALGRSPDTRDLPLLFTLIRARPLAGVIETLGKFRRPGALPFFIQALEDDFLRASAQDAISRLGRRALRPLVHAALDRDPMIGRETPASVTRRRSTMELIESLSPAREALPPAFFRLVDDDDPWIALRATRICLPHMPPAAAAGALTSLMAHLRSPDNLLAYEIEDILVENYPMVATVIADTLDQPHPALPVWRTTDHTGPTLERVKRRAAHAAAKDASHG